MKQNPFESNGHKPRGNNHSVRNHRGSFTAHLLSARRGGHVLITGGAGFIGTNVASLAIRRGHRVLVLDNLSRPGVERNLQWLKKTYGSRVDVMIGDVRDPAALRYGVEGALAIFHFAAQVAVTTSLDRPLEDHAINVQGTLNVLEASRELASPPPLLFTSTNKVYGELSHIDLEKQGDQYGPRSHEFHCHGVSERVPLDFHSPYGCSKGAADQYVLDYARCYHMPNVVFRMSCIYGPHQQGTEDQGWVAHFVRQVLHGEPLTIYGDGCQVRDLLFIKDLAIAMLSAIERIEITRGRAFNMGGGPRNAISLLQMMRMLAEIHGEMPQFDFADWRRGDQRWYVSDTARFREAMNWKPSVGVRDGLQRLYRWLAKNDHAEPLVAVARPATSAAAPLREKLRPKNRSKSA